MSLKKDNGNVDILTKRR